MTKREKAAVRAIAHIFTGPLDANVSDDILALNRAVDGNAIRACWLLVVARRYARLLGLPEDG